MKKVYISGKITGIENEAPLIFSNAESMLQSHGFFTINPLSLKHDHDKSWCAYMKEDIKALCDCNCIYMLSNWQASKGAKIEHQIALYLNLEIIYSNGDF